MGTSSIISTTHSEFTSTARKLSLYSVDYSYFIAEIVVTSCMDELLVIYASFPGTCEDYTLK